MAYPQIRINKTKEIQKTLDFFKSRFNLLGESEIIKMLLSQAYFQYNQMNFDASDLEKKQLLYQASKSFNIHKNDNEPHNINANSKC